jgi:CheY-like chemotaxis protein
MRLVTAVNGTLGIELARTAQPEVILMDINLPDISGIEALKILRDDPATAHIPVVALSANAMPRDIEVGMKTGFFRYLTKPMKVNELMDALHAALAIADTATVARVETAIMIRHRTSTTPASWWLTTGWPTSACSRGRCAAPATRRSRPPCNRRMSASCIARIATT